VHLFTMTLSSPRMDYRRRRVFFAAFVLGFLVDPEDVGGMFFRNAYCLLGVKSQKTEHVLVSTLWQLEIHERRRLARMVSSTESCCNNYRLAARRQ
jgi:hypothetical protein